VFIKNADKVTNQAEIENWNYYNMEAKAQFTLTLKNEPSSGAIYTITATDIWDKLN